jgi:hypothetical protein
MSFKVQIYWQASSPDMMYIIPGNDSNQIRQFRYGILLKGYTTLYILHGYQFFCIPAAT